MSPTVMPCGWNEALKSSLLDEGNQWLLAGRKNQFLQDKPVDRLSKLSGYP